MKVEYIYGWSDVAALIMAGCNILYGRWFLGGESSWRLSHYCMRHQIKNISCIGKKQSGYFDSQGQVAGGSVRICRTQSTIPAGETHAKIGNNPGSGKASGPTTIDLHEIFR